MSKFYVTIEKIIYVLVCLYFIDIIVFGTGTLTRIGPLSTRIIIGIVAVLFSLPVWIKNKYKNKCVIAVAVFFIILFIGLVWGVLNNNSYIIMKSDISGFSHMLIVLPMLCCLDSEESVIRLLKIFAGCLNTCAIATIILTFYCKFPEKLAEKIHIFLNSYGIGGISELTGNAVRVFLHTPSRLFVVAFIYYLALCMIFKKDNKKRIVAMSINLVAAFVSYTRSLYLGTFVAFCIALIMAIIFLKEDIVQLFRYLGSSISLAIVLILVLSILQHTNLFLVAIDRCLFAGDFFAAEENIEDDRDDRLDSYENVPIDSEFNNSEIEWFSVSIRKQRQEMALGNFKKNPLLGCGLGVVNDPNGEQIELFYLDILSKIGIVGTFAFFLPYIMIIYDFVTKRYNRTQRFILFAGIVSVTYAMSFSYFNPFMNSAIGLSLYGLCISQTCIWKKERN